MLASLNQTFYLIRQVGSLDNYEAGYGMSSTPKLYNKSSAFSVVGKRNKAAAIPKIVHWSELPVVDSTRWEAVPITITVK